MRNKTLFLRLTFVVLAAGVVYCCRGGLTDYVILLVAILFFGAFFFVSETTVTDKLVIIRKRYCWALIPLTWAISYKHIYDIQAHVRESSLVGEGDGSAASFLASLLEIFFAATVTWKNHRLEYEHHGVIKHIEVKLDHDQYIDIWRRMKGKDIIPY